MWANTGCQAIQSGRRVELQYNGYTRVVEVHAVGRSTAGNDVARVWQVRGGSVSNEPVGWKLMVLDEALGARILNERSEAPRPGYKPGDKGMTWIQCEV